MRAYTVFELDALRGVVEHKWLFGRYKHPPQEGMTYLSRSYKEEDKVKAVEEIVRTHMLAGHTAEMLLASETNDD